MKRLPLFLLLCICTTISAQQFAFTIHFQDAAGNRDSIVLGYDANATSGIDTLWDEINISETPSNNGLDVRITDDWENMYYQNIPGTFQTKKQIIRENCSFDTLFPRQVISIHTLHWPVTASWDSTLFEPFCRNGSFFTGANPGGWWDVGTPSQLHFQEFDTDRQVTFYENNVNPSESYYGYINQFGDILSVFWQMFIPQGFVDNTNEPGNAAAGVKIFPNPTTGDLFVETLPDFGAVQTIDILTITGQSVLSVSNKHSISINHLQRGAYLIRVSNDRGQNHFCRVLKP